MERGSSIPHFEVNTTDGERLTYAAIWQRRNVVLALLPDEDPDRLKYAAAMSARAPDLAAQDAACVVTSDAVPPLSAPALVVADRWGEIAFLAERQHVAELPTVDEVLDWLEYLQHKCPECEGESR
jgi:peroxiredoxin